MSSLPLIDVHSVTYHDSLHAFLKVLGSTNSFFLPEDQLAFSTLDGLTEVLEWNNEGQAADEIACIWLASLRWYTRTGNLLSSSAPYSLSRTLTAAMPEHAGDAADPATLTGLALPDMQLLDRNVHRDETGPGALLRCLPIALLPVDQDQTVAVIAAKVAALTHGSDLAISSAAAIAVLARAALSFRGQSATPLAEAIAYTKVWAHGLDANTAIPGDGMDIANVLTFGETSHNPSLEAEEVAETALDSSAPRNAVKVVAKIVEQLNLFESQDLAPHFSDTFTAEETLIWTVSSAIIALAHGSQALEISVDDNADEALMLVEKQWKKELGMS